MLSRIIRWLYYVLFFVTPLLMNPKTSEIFEFNKMMFLYFGTTLITTVWLISKFRENRATYFTWLFIPFIFFLLTQILSTIFSIDVHTSIYGYYGRFNGGLLSIIAYISLLYIFTDIFTIDDLPNFLRVSLFSSAVVILWGLPGKFNADLSCLLFTHDLSNDCWTDQFRPAERMFSTLGQPNWLGAYLALNFFIGLYFYLSNKSKNKVIYFSYLAYIILNFLTILFSRSKSALGAVVITGIIFVTILYLKKLWVKNWKLFIVLGVAFLISILIFKTGVEKIDQYIPFENKPAKTASVVKSPPVQTEDGGVTDSFDIRKIVWKGAWLLAQKYPVFGTGVETFAYSYYFVRPIEHNYTSEWDFLYNKAHNEYLNYLATTGFVGITGYLLMIFVTLYLYSKVIFFPATEKQKHNQLMFICGLSAYITILITNALGFSITSISIYFYVLPALPLLFLKPEHSSKHLHPSAGWKKELPSFVITLAAVFVLWNIWKYYVADLNYAQANTYTNQEETQKAMSAYSDALDYRYEHVYEDRLSYSLANLAFITYYSDEKDIAKRLIYLSDAYNKRSLKAASMNVLYWKTRAKNYYIFYQINKNKQYMQEALNALDVAAEISPTDPKISYTKAVLYSSLAKKESNTQKKEQYEKKEVQELNKSLSLKRDYIDALVLQKELQVQPK